MNEFNINFTDIVGFAAACCTTFSFLPQIAKSIRLKSAGDLSYPMLSMSLVRVALWIVYGLKSQAVPVIAANITTFIILGTMMGVKVTFDRRSRR